MKKHITKFIALLLLATAISSCSVEYRQRHHHDGYDHNGGDNHGHDNHQ